LCQPTGQLLNAEIIAYCTSATKPAKLRTITGRAHDQRAWARLRRRVRERYRNQRLAGKAPVKQLPALGGTYFVMRSTLKNEGDVRGVVLGEEDGNELVVFALCVVKLLSDDVPLPGPAQAFPWLFLALESTQVGLRASHQNEL